MLHAKRMIIVVAYDIYRHEPAVEDVQCNILFHIQKQANIADAGIISLA